MTRFIKQITVMSVTLLLFCTTIAAQNEINTKDARNTSYGVTLSKGSDELGPKEIGYYTITVLHGYKNPILIYNGTSIEIDTEITTSAFTAKIIYLAGQYLVKVTALNVSSPVVDTIYVKAPRAYDEYDRSITQMPGVPLVITVNPFKSKQTN